ncbi:hypothetical protein TA3x_004709 [Tundrisphaera sp. TA3]|uniref:hypothetical protein n=1 Tax=Tundrisphaera sp. TA3 TaxID=3435775 RepID=UPI003EB79DF4
MPDYYALLGVDPDADRAMLENALARLQPVWSSGTRNPKTKHIYQSYLDRIPEMRRCLLGTAEARTAYDAERTASLRADREARLDAMQRLVRLRAAKGGLTKADRDALRERAGRMGVDAADLSHLVAPFPDLKPEAAVTLAAPEPSSDVLDPVTRTQIASVLVHLNRSDLYDALGLPRDAPLDEIADRAGAERRLWMQKAQVTAEKTAWLEAISHAQTHLGTPERRARYDRTLILEAEERAAEAIAFALEGVTRLDGGTRLALIEEAAARGIAPDRALILIDRGCQALGVGRDAAAFGLFSASIEPPRHLRCRSCSGLTEFEELNAPGARPECRHCRKSLRWNCPACKQERWVDEARCACGFPQAFREPLARHLDAARRAHLDRDFAASLDHLQRVLHYAPTHAGARKGIESIRRSMAQAEAARTSCETARARRHLVAARAAILAWGRLVPDDSAEFASARDEIARGLRMAQIAAARGKAAEAEDPRSARAWFEKALSISADLDDALQGLRRCPPEPPAGLVADFDLDRVRLRWTAPAPDPIGPIRFRVVRKRDGRPTLPNDGVVIAETAEAEVEDPTVTAGDSVGYAVFSVRGEAISGTPAAAGPVMIVPEVMNLAAEARTGEIRLTWNVPQRAYEVRVTRNLSHRPAHARDGEPIPATDGEAIDRGLIDGRTYHYLVTAIYRGPDGSEHLSRGLGISAVPQAAVGAIGPPSISRNIHGSVQLAWDRPARGSVKLIRTASALPHQPGDRLPLAATARWEGAWIDVMGDDHAIDESPPPAGLCVYTPIAIGAGGATVGHPARYSCVADPSDLRAVRAGNGGRVHLRWRWSPHGTESRVAARAGVPPSGPDDPEAIVTSVADSEYGRLGYLAMTLPPTSNGPWHLAVFSVVSARGEEIVSPGLEPTARTVVPGPNPEVTVSYVLRRPMFPGRAWSVSFRTDPAGATIPPTALVAHPRTVPLSPDDGEIVVRFPAARDGESFPIPGHVDLARRRTRVFADPSSDPSGLPPIRLRHPEGGGTRV